MTRQRKTWIGWSLGLLAAAALVFAFVPKPVAVDVAVVSRGPITVTVNEDGKTRIRERYLVSSPLNGMVQRLQLHPGDSVSAGATILTTLLPTPPNLLDARTRAQAEARVKAAESFAAQNSALHARAGTAHAFAARELERARALFQANTLSKQELDVLEEKAQAASEELKAAQFATRIAAFELELARAALIRTSEDCREILADWSLPIVSPITGKVLRVLQENSAVVQPGTALLELGDPRDLEMEIDVLSTDGVNIRPGARVLVEHWGGPEALEGRVRLVEPAAFTKISALGVEEQRVNVIADFTGDPARRQTLGDAFRIEARIVTADESAVLKIPTAALFRSGRNWALFTVENRRAALRLVTIGLMNENEAAVSDLPEGTQVIIHPSDLVGAGKRVRVR